MKRLLLLAILIVVGAIPLAAQIDAFQGHCTLGGTKAITSGLNSTNYNQGIIPGCTVEVFFTGTTTHAPIFSNATGTPLANPFTAVQLPSANPGYWIFWAADNQGYDVKLYGGNANPGCTTAPNCYTVPLTYTDLRVGGGGSSGGVTTFQSGNLPPLFTTTPNAPTAGAVSQTFNFQTTSDKTFLGNCTGSTANWSVCALIAGSNVNFTESGGNLTINATPASTLTLQHEGVPINQNLLNFIDNSYTPPTGTTKVFFDPNISNGDLGAYVGQTPPALKIGIIPPDSNQGIFIPFVSFNINKIDPCGLITSASQDATSGAILSVPGTLICHNSEAIFNWTAAVLPAGIPAANVTSVRAVASYQLLQGGLSFICNGVSLPPTPDIPFSQQMIVLPGITGTNIGTASCSLDMIQSLAGTIMDGAVSQIGLWVEYTGTPVTDPSLKVQYPLLYTSYDNTLSINSYWPNSVTALKVADLPAASAFQAGPGFPQYLVKDLVDDTYGVTATGGGTKYGWVQSNGSGYTVSSGFANTLENGFVGDVPYQTGPNKTAYLHPGKTPGHTYAVGWKPGIPAVVQGAGCGQTCTFPQPVTAGDLIFVLTSDTATIAPVGCGISDSFGTTYTLQQSSGNVVKTYTGIAATSGNVVISLTGADASHCYGSIAEITGADSVTPVDVNGSVASGLGTSVNPTITTTLNNDLLIAWEGLTNSAPVTITPSAGLTFIGGTGNNTYATNSWSAPGTTAGAYSATFTSSGPSGVYAFYGGIVGIKGAAAGGATDPVAIDITTGTGGTYFTETLTCTTTCTLSHTPTTFINLAINGLVQVSGTDFTISGTTVTPTVAPSPGDVVYAQYYY